MCCEMLLRCSADYFSQENALSSVMFEFYEIVFHQQGAFGGNLQRLRVDPDKFPGYVTQITEKVFKAYFRSGQVSGVLI